MADKEMNTCSHHMTPDSMAAFIEREAERGASENMIRRLKAAVKMLYDFLPEDKQITQEQLLKWRAELNERRRRIIFRSS